MKISILIYYTLISLGFLFTGKTLKEANKAYRNNEFRQAIVLFEKNIENSTTIVAPEMAIKMASCYYYLNDYKNAKKYFDLAGEANLSGNDKLTYGKLLFLQGDLEHAKEFFSSESSDQAKNYLAQLEWVQDKKTDTSFFAIEKTGINTQGQSFGVQYYQGGIVFSSASNTVDIIGSESKKNDMKSLDVKGLSFLNLYYSPMLNKGEIGKPVLFSENLAFDYHVGATSFSSDYKTMYYTKVVQTKNEDNVLKIFSASYKGGTWIEDGALKFNSDKYSCAHPALSTTGDTLFFVSNLPDGKGDKDIYFVKKNSEIWSEPINFKAINTNFDEVFPFVSNKNILYFSSEGRAGYGGLDIYSYDLSGKDSMITNLRYGINSRFDDFAFVINPENEKEGFISSNRSTGGRSDNIYKIFSKTPAITITESTPEIDTVVPELITNTVNVTSRIQNALSGDPLNAAHIVVKNELNQTPIFDGISDINGKTSFTIDKTLIDPESNITITVTGKGKFKVYTTTGTGKELINLNTKFTYINLVPIIEETQTITIPHNNLKFALNSFELNYEAKAILERWFEYLNNNKNTRLRLNAHTDSQGDLDYNLQLSQQRADNAKAYLVQRGIDAKRIIARGYGERYILNQCKDGVECSDADHIVNRRIEIIVIVD